MANEANTRHAADQRTAKAEGVERLNIQRLLEEVFPKMGWRIIGEPEVTPIGSYGAYDLLVHLDTGSHANLKTMVEVKTRTDNHDRYNYTFLSPKKYRRLRQTWSEARRALRPYNMVLHASFWADGVVTIHNITGIISPLEDTAERQSDLNERPANVRAHQMDYSQAKQEEDKIVMWNKGGKYRRIRLTS